jgi:hypothetical protein
LGLAEFTGKKAPAVHKFGPDKEANWLPAGDGPFYLIVRSYAPTKQMMDILIDVNAWPIPAVVPVK